MLSVSSIKCYKDDYIANWSYSMAFEWNTDQTWKEMICSLKQFAGSIHIGAYTESDSILNQARGVTESMDVFLV